MAESRLDIDMALPRLDKKLYGPKRIGTTRRQEPMTLESVIRDIKLKKLAPDVEVELIKLASKYPHGALPSFKKNMGRFIVNIQRSEN